MAGKPLNRLELRRQNDAAEPLDPMEDESEELIEELEDEDSQEKRTKRKKVAPKAKVKPAKPATRMRIVWVVMNDAFKPVGAFEFSQKEAAEARAAELTAKGKGMHFVQKVKEPMPENAPGLGAAIPRPAVEPAGPAVKATTAAVEDEDDLEEEEEGSDPELDEEVDEEE